MVETTAAAPRMHWGVGRIGFGVGAGLGLALVAFASGGYFPTAWAWGALVALTVVAAFLVLGDVVRPSSLALTSLGGLTGLAAWTWLALTWSDVASATVLEGLRMLLYVSVLAALVLIVRLATVPVLLWASFVAVFLVSGYGLLTRLFPERLGVFDPIAGGRLAEPLTYSNALGVFAAMGVLLGLGLAARAHNVVARAAAGATLPLLNATVYFTFSRGAWIAAAIGLAVAVTIDPRRLQFVLDRTPSGAHLGGRRLGCVEGISPVTHRCSALSGLTRWPPARRVPPRPCRRLRPRCALLGARRTASGPTTSGTACLRRTTGARRRRVPACNLRPLRRAGHYRSPGLRRVYDHERPRSRQPERAPHQLLRNPPPPDLASGLARLSSATQFSDQGLERSSSTGTSIARSSSS